MKFEDICKKKRWRTLHTWKIPSQLATWQCSFKEYRIISICFLILHTWFLIILTCFLIIYTWFLIMHCTQDCFNNISCYKNTFIWKVEPVALFGVQKTFLYDKREPRYKQNNMGYKISRIWNIEQSNNIKLHNCIIA